MTMNNWRPGFDNINVPIPVARWCLNLQYITICTRLAPRFPFLCADAKIIVSMNLYWFKRILFGVSPPSAMGL